MHKKIILLLTLLLPWTLAAQEEIRTAVGDTVLRKVRKIERRDFFNGRPQLYLENSGIEALPTKVPFSYVKSIRFEDGCEVFSTFGTKGSGDIFPDQISRSNHET